MKNPGSDTHETDIFMQDKNALTHNIQEKILSFQKNIELNPQDFSAYNELGDALYKQGFYSEAEKNFRHALTLKPNDITVLNNLGIALCAQKKWNDAKEIFETSLQHHPYFSDTYKNLGIALRELGALEHSTKVFETAIALNAQDPVLYNALGDIFFKQKNFKAAENHFRSALKLTQDDASLFNNLGLALHIQSHYEEAHKQFQKAIELDPHRTETWINKGAVLHDLGQLKEASQNYREALRYHPNDPNLHNALGDVFYKLGIMEKAKESFIYALHLAPLDIAILNNLASVFLRQAQWIPLEKVCRQILAIAPKHIDACRYLGAALRELGQLQEAKIIYKQALALQPDLLETLNNLGLTHLDLNEFTEAEQCFRKALALKPSFSDASTNLIVLLGDKTHRYAEAVTVCQEAIQANPDNADAYNGLANALRHKDHFEAIAESHYKKAFALKGQALHGFNLSHCLLAQGKIKEGFEYYEYRLTKNADENITHFLNEPPWRGQSVYAEDSLVVYSEQGMGDIIQFSRFLPFLIKIFKHVALLTHTPLVTLMQNSFPNIEVIDLCALEEPRQTRQFDWGCPVMSLPYALDIHHEATIPNQPYLAVTQESQKKWSTLLNRNQGNKGNENERQAHDAEHTHHAMHANDLKHENDSKHSKHEHHSHDLKQAHVGLIWSGSNASYASKRNIPIELFVQALHTLPYRWFNLGFPSSQEDIAYALQKYDMVIEDGMNDSENFADTAALIQQLDFVIAVDTAVAHIAGGLGKPVYMLNRKHGDFRWIRDRSDTPWYPSMHILTQAQEGDWSDVLQALYKKLKQ